MSMVWIKNVPDAVNDANYRKFLCNLGILEFSVKEKSVTGYSNRVNMFWVYTEPMRKALEGRKPPHRIGFYFVRSNMKHGFRPLVAVGIIGELLVAHNILISDDAENFIPVFIPNQRGKFYHMDRKNPGVYLFTEPLVKMVYC